MTGTVADRWGETVPVAPFADWLVEQEKRVGSREELADRLGLGPRRIYEYVSGRQKRVSIAVVDRVCCRVGVHIADLYPELYSDLDEDRGETVNRRSGARQRGVLADRLTENGRAT